MDSDDILNELDEADFSTKMRGYDPFEVDELLDRAGQEIAALRGEVKSATDRADLADARLEAELEAARSARTEAERTLSEAESEAARLGKEAAADAERVRAAAELELREAIEAGRTALLEETAALTESRDSVRDDIAMTEQHLLAHRDRILQVAEDLRSVAGSLPTRPLPGPAPGRPEGADGPTGAPSRTPGPATALRAVEAEADPAMPGRVEAPASDSPPTPGGPGERTGLSAAGAGAVGGDAGDMDAFFAVEEPGPGRFSRR